MRTLRSLRVTPRALNAFDATLLVMGGIIGVGIFFNAQQVAALVPDPTWFLTLWAIGGLVALLGALTFAELGASLPHAGGWYVFLRTAFGPFPAFLFACVVLFVVSTGAIAVMASFCVEQLAGLVPGISQAPSTSANVAGVVVIVGVTCISMLGVKVGATFQNACMLIKLTAIFALVVAAWLWAGASEPPRVEHVTAPEGAVGALSSTEQGSLLGRAVRAMLPVLFACGGWQMLFYIAPRVRDPQRTLPRAILFGVMGVVVLYVALNA